MKKSKQKSRRFKRYIRKQLNKAKKDIENLEMEINLVDTSSYPAINGFGHYPGGLSHDGVLPRHDGSCWHDPHRDNSAHLHNPHVPRHDHCHGSDSIKVFYKKDSEIRVEKKM